MIRDEIGYFYGSIVLIPVIGIFFILPPLRHRNGQKILPIPMALLA
jgi:hypothetical protein